MKDEEQLKAATPSKTVTPPIDIIASKQSSDEDGSLLGSFMALFSPSKTPPSRMSSSSSSSVDSVSHNPSLYPRRGSASSASSPSLFSVSGSTISPDLVPSLPLEDNKTPRYYPVYGDPDWLNPEYDEPAWFQPDPMDESTIKDICQRIEVLMLQIAEMPHRSKVKRLSTQIEALARDIIGDLEVARSASIRDYLQTLDDALKQQCLTVIDRFDKRQARLIGYLEALDSVSQKNFLTAAQSLHFREPFFNELRTIAEQFVINQAKQDSQSVVSNLSRS